MKRCASNTHMGRRVTKRSACGISGANADRAIRTSDAAFTQGREEFSPFMALPTPYEGSSGLKNRKIPDDGEPAIVTAVLPSAIFDPGEATAGSPYFQEPLTFVLGIYREEEFLEFRLVSRRFEPFDC